MEKLSGIRACVFDAYGTLFDVYSVALAAEQLFPQHGQKLAQLWRERQIEYTRLVSMSGPAHYRPFWDLTRAALRQSAALLKLYESNASTLTPDPVFVKFYYSHPPATERLGRILGSAH